MRKQHWAYFLFTLLLVALALSGCGDDADDARNSGEPPVNNPNVQPSVNEEVPVTTMEPGSGEGPIIVDPTLTPTGTIEAIPESP
jgi:hypothetical protein